MKINIRSISAILLMLVLAAWAAWHVYSSGKDTRIETTVSAPEVPVVIRTEGGLLEVATVMAQERFTRSDTREFWGIHLGTTVSHIQAPVHYRYHIELAREWRVVIRDKTCIVQAPAIKPSLPVAFDTSAMQMYTQNGWARLNKHDNLAALARSMTPELEKRAQSPAYRQLVTEPARQTVREFVMQWLIKEQKWSRDPAYTVEVLFPGESLPVPRTSPRPESAI
ncbi:hypothetical protein [Polaromonas sp.]|uniref:hypothetical protein n=1 Tax=Polaromonas sp. TaxID=1869339 RepID=UPI003264C9EA